MKKESNPQPPNGVTAPPPPPQPPAVQKAALPVGEHGLILQDLGAMLRFATMVVTSRLGPKDLDTPEKVLVAIQMGAEVGLSPMTSVQNTAVVNNRPSLYGEVAWALVLDNPHIVDVREWFTDDDDPAMATAHCQIELDNRKTPAYACFGPKDVALAGIGGGNVHTKYPKDMRMWRARFRVGKSVTPGATRGFRIYEEMMDVKRQQVELDPDDVEVVDVDPIADLKAAVVAKAEAEGYDVDDAFVAGAVAEVEAEIEAAARAAGEAAEAEPPYWPQGEDSQTQPVDPPTTPDGKARRGRKQGKPVATADSLFD